MEVGDAPLGVEEEGGVDEIVSAVTEAVAAELERRDLTDAVERGEGVEGEGGGRGGGGGGPGR